MMHASINYFYEFKGIIQYLIISQNEEGSERKELEFIYTLIICLSPDGYEGKKHNLLV